MKENAYLVSTGTRLEVLVGEIEFFNTKGASMRVSNLKRALNPETSTYQNSSSSSMTESICWRLDIVAAKLCGADTGNLGL